MMRRDDKTGTEFDDQVQDHLHVTKYPSMVCVRCGSEFVPDGFDGLIEIKDIVQ